MREKQFSALMLAGCVVILFFGMLFVPEWMVNRYAGPLDRMQYSTLVDAYRKTLAQIIGGIALFAGLYFTWRGTRATEDGRITDRFSKAVEQLGATDKNGRKQMEPRLGGIYALERIARDSKRDHRPIMSLLCAYIRENSPRPYVEIDNETGQPLGADPEYKKVSSDVQAVLKILSSLRSHYVHYEDDSYDLNDTALMQADVTDCMLAGVDFSRAILVLADFSRGRLPRADFRNALAGRARFVKADLVDAMFYRANLSGCDMYGANLSGANLSESNLSGAKLKNALMGLSGEKSTNLRGAILKGTDLSGVNLTFVSGLSAKQMQWVKMDEKTILPPAVVEELKALRGVAMNDDADS